MASVTVTLRKLRQEEAARAFPRRGQMDASQHAAALRALTIGDSAEFALDGLSNRAVKRRFGLAATQVGCRLKWASTTVDDRLYRRVLVATASPARAERSQRTRSPARQPEAPTVAPSQPAAASPTRGLLSSADTNVRRSGSLATTTSTGYCMKCRLSATPRMPRSTMKNGRPATQGACAVCEHGTHQLGRIAWGAVARRICQKRLAETA